MKIGLTKRPISTQTTSMGTLRLLALLLLLSGAVDLVAAFASSSLPTKVPTTSVCIPHLAAIRTPSLRRNNAMLVLLEAQSTSPDKEKKNPISALRTSLRKATGFSLTALRATCRAATGISLSTIYLATVAATGNWIRQTTKFVLSIFPPWARYFAQPFLILYYVPIFILRNVTGPARREARETHQAVLDSWKEAVQKADEKVAYWPIHVDEDGNIESDIGELDMQEAVVESIEIARDDESEGPENQDKK